MVALAPCAALVGSQLRFLRGPCRLRRLDAGPRNPPSKRVFFREFAT